MEDRKTQELVELQGRKFIIKMMPAALSLSILKELLSRALPLDIFAGIIVDGESLGNKLSKAGMNSSNQMSIDEFVALENRLMGFVEERLAGGDEKIIDSFGNYQVSNLENNLSLYTDLLLKVVSVNYKDFFIEKLEQLGILKKKEGLSELAQSFLE